MSSSNLLSAAAAARACGVGRTTIMRKLATGSIPDAQQDESGKWLITFDGLKKAGFHPSGGEVPKPVDTVGQLRQELADERRRRAVAEAVAEERAAQLRDLRKVIRSLESRTEK